MSDLYIHLVHIKIAFIREFAKVNQGDSWNGWYAWYFWNGYICKNCLDLDGWIGMKGWNKTKVESVQLGKTLKKNGVWKNFGS